MSKFIACLVAVAAISLTAGESQAQYYRGGGFGYGGFNSGFGGFNSGFGGFGRSGISISVGNRGFGGYGGGFNRGFNSGFGGFNSGFGGGYYAPVRRVSYSPVYSRGYYGGGRSYYGGGFRGGCGY